ncbi:MAG: glycosyl transferase family protein [Alphaproteobacteria bacterium]|nr:glycosyl transferase family protein [Alphaproteobacteria bacterium]
MGLLSQLDAAEWLALVQHELFLFATFFFILGALDEFAVDLTYGWLRLRGKAATGRVDEAELRARPLAGIAAIFVPAWDEARVIRPMLTHSLLAWPQAQVRFFIGCYRNDPATFDEASIVARSDARVHLVVHDRDGPTSKADCLNALYAALVAEEERAGRRARMVVLHDAEDMVDPAALAALDMALDHAEFIQLPVLALPQPRSRFIGSHYCDEFAEAHGKVMVVRSGLGAGIPGAGVGSAVERCTLARLAELTGGLGPFATTSLTEDYEFGLNVGSIGGRDRFLRLRTREGRLIATRAYFPSRIDTAIRQKTRWIHGIALQGWDRLGWNGGFLRTWMKLRDRQGPFAAFLLALAYLLVLGSGLIGIAGWFGLFVPFKASPLLATMLAICGIAFVWRALIRAIFTGREFGWREGLLAVVRIPVSNCIAIMAGRRALMAYIATLRGAEAQWDKTEHLDHPTSLMREHGSI